MEFRWLVGLVVLVCACPAPPSPPDLSPPPDLSAAPDLSPPLDLSPPADLSPLPDLDPGFPPETLQPLPELRSQQGVLSTTLTAAPATVLLQGKNVRGGAYYNGRSPATTWRVRPGDQIRVRVQNDLADHTNLHFHGAHVSPTGSSDNVFVMIHPGGAFDYQVAVPLTHNPGLLWYHPHHHGNSDAQVLGGMAGMLVVEGGHDQLPGIAGARERVLVYQHWMIYNGALVDDLRADIVQTLNGQESPTIGARPGEVQFFRLGNASNLGWLALKLDGHRLRVLAEDGSSYAAPEDRDELLLPPGKRYEFAVQFGAAGSYALRNQGHRWGLLSTPAATLATVTVSGPPLAGQALPTTGVALPRQDAVLRAAVDARHTITFTDDPMAGRYQIDGKEFDPNRVDLQPKLGAVEEWTIVNRTLEDHPFHIHVNEFALVQVNGQPVATPRFQDVAAVPAMGSVVIKQRFADFTGKFVFHCHVLFHEDRGMMATIEVVP